MAIVEWELIKEEKGHCLYKHTVYQNKYRYYGPDKPLPTGRSGTGRSQAIMQMKLAVKTMEQKEKEEYTCDACGETFEKDWTDEEAQEEFECNFPTHTIRDQAIVCDDCYNTLMKK